jgi:predicted dehydrogenase
VAGVSADRAQANQAPPPCQPCARFFGKKKVALTGTKKILSALSVQRKEINMDSQNVSRRSFIKSAAVLGVAAQTIPLVGARAQGAGRKFKVALVGCGGRGNGAIGNFLEACKLVGVEGELVATADVFKDKAVGAGKKYGVPADRCFDGFNGYRKALALPIDVILLATAPAFRPVHMEAAIAAGKHVFMEKPVAVDGPGVRMVIEAGELARKKGLGISAGTQRRHQANYIETIKRLHDGAIGDIVYARCYWNGGEIWVIDRTEAMTDMEWQLRNWNYFTWLGGDHIVEQHVHNLDIMRWVMNTPPLKATALGGRQVRTSKNHGHIFDHFAVEFEYPNGVRMFSQCRQINGCEGKVEEAVQGTKGHSNCQNWILGKDGTRWRFQGNQPNPYEQEHLDLINSIRAGQPINEAKNIAESTLMGIMGRESAYSGQSLEWEKALNSPTRLGPEKYEFGALPFPPVALPGKYRFV